MNKSIILAVGQQCFVSCKGCYNHFSSKSLISSEYFVHFVKLMIDEYRIDKVTVGGGDPLTRSDILKLLQDLKKLNIRINLDTVGISMLYDVQNIMNGRDITPKIDYREILVNVDLLGLPIDAANEQTNSLFRYGRTNLLYEIYSLLEILKNAPIDIGINTVMHKGNFHELLDISDKIAKYTNIIKWQVFQFLPTGPIGSYNWKNFCISDEDYSQNLEKLRKHINDMGYHYKLEGKSRNHRKNIYIIVDSAGDIWCPKTHLSKEWQLEADRTNERVVFGNIRDNRQLKANIDQIIAYQGH